ncbi:MAG: YdbH domain-containing protein [Verrucomicrobia bacterium]|nr:YdbH domain-containing protein [Verrucomicrobiota bacterium]
MAVLLGGGAVVARAEAWPWRGAVAGELRVETLGELGLKWELAITGTKLVLTGTAPGLTVVVGAEPKESGAWAWRIEQGAADLAELWPVLRRLAGEAATGWSASGRLNFSGAGSWSAESGPAGELRVELREGWARSDALDVEVSGIELDGVTRDFSGETLAEGQQLRIAKVVKAGAEARELKVEFGLKPGLNLAVARASASLLGGGIKLKPFQVSLSKPRVNAAADVTGVQLAELARLMPWAVAAAEGKLRGRIEIGWDEQKGLRVRDGGLDIVRSDAAEFRLAPSPGLLTGNMPEVFRWLPKAGAWAKGIGLRNPAYAPLREIELGREGLKIEALQVTFWPDGLNGARTATIHVVGRPTSEKLVKELVIDLNFYGPWSEFMAFGLNQEAKYGFRLQ